MKCLRLLLLGAVLHLAILSDSHAYNVDAKKISVSGISSGSYMAGQLHVAYSGTFMGAGLVAGGPYYCAQGMVYKALTTCMNGPVGRSDLQNIVKTARDLAQSGEIDPIENLKTARVYFLNGQFDTTVVRNVSDAALDFYKKLGSPSDQLYFVGDMRAAHTFPTLSYGTNCDTGGTPFISRCNYDAAGDILEHIYGDLESRGKAKDSNFFELSQEQFVKNPSAASLADKAIVYVPTACQNGEECGLHVAIHGCKQTMSDIGGQFYKNTGYPEWAETNNLIVLFPQTIRTSALGSNPNGCWDWWGYTGVDYHLKSGTQMKAIYDMVQFLSQE